MLTPATLVVLIAGHLGAAFGIVGLTAGPLVSPLGYWCSGLSRFLASLGLALSARYAVQAVRHPFRALGCQEPLVSLPLALLLALTGASSFIGSLLFWGSGQVLHALSATLWVTLLAAALAGLMISSSRQARRAW